MEVFLQALQISQADSMSVTNVSTRFDLLHQIYHGEDISSAKEIFNNYDSGFSPGRPSWDFVESFMCVDGRNNVLES